MAKLSAIPSPPATSTPSAEESGTGPGRVPGTAPLTPVGGYQIRYGAFEALIESDSLSGLVVTRAGIVESDRGSGVRGVLTSEGVRARLWTG